MYIYKNEISDLETFSLRFNDKYFIDNNINNKHNYIEKIYIEQLKSLSSVLSSTEIIMLNETIKYCKKT